MNNISYETIEFFKLFEKWTKMKTEFSLNTLFYKLFDLYLTIFL